MFFPPSYLEWAASDTDMSTWCSGKGTTPRDKGTTAFSDINPPKSSNHSVHFDQFRCFFLNCSKYPDILAFSDTTQIDENSSKPKAPFDGYHDFQFTPSY